MSDEAKREELNRELNERLTNAIEKFAEEEGLTKDEVLQLIRDLPLAPPET